MSVFLQYSIVIQTSLFPRNLPELLFCCLLGKNPHPDTRNHTYIHCAHHRHLKQWVHKVTPAFRSTHVSGIQRDDLGGASTDTRDIFRGEPQRQSSAKTEAKIFTNKEDYLPGRKSLSSRYFKYTK